MQMNHPNLSFYFDVLVPIRNSMGEIDFLFCCFKFALNENQLVYKPGHSPQVSKKKNLKFYPDAIPVKGNPFWVPSYIIFSLAALSTHRILVPSFLPIQLWKYHLYSLYTTGKERKSLCRRSMDYVVSPGKIQYLYSLT